MSQEQPSQQSGGQKETRIVDFPPTAVTGEDAETSLAAGLEKAGRAEPIFLPSGSLGFAETANEFFERVASRETLFLRGGRVVELEKESGDGALSLSIVTARALQSKIESYGTPCAYRVGPHGDSVLKKTRLSLESAQVWLESEERKLLPPVIGIYNAPVLVADGIGGVALLPKGYHKPTGLLVTNGTKPESAGLDAGIATIEELIAEFDFATPSDKARAVAAIISPALRFGGLLQTHFPLFAIEADASQAGKGYLLELIQTIYHETPSFVIEKNGGVGAFDESLSQAMLTGRPFVQFDNVRGRINSAFLEAILTCPLRGSVPARVPYRGEIQVAPAQFIFQLTSNGFESTPDLANRSCIIRIRRRRGYRFRRFAEGRLIEHVTANQPRFLGAVHTVVTEWMKRGRLATDDMRGPGRFRHWAQIFDWIVQDCGLPPLLDGHDRAQESACNPRLMWMRQLALAVEATGELGEELSASRIGEISADADLSIPGLHDEVEEKKRRLVIGGVMGRLFGGTGTIAVEGFTVRRTLRTESREEGGLFQAKNYVFERKVVNQPCAFPHNTAQAAQHPETP